MPSATGLVANTLVSFRLHSELQGQQQQEEEDLKGYLITIHIVFLLFLAGENTVK